ncbi:MAG: ABC transporter substrate-binding protein [Armatimonadota bacterium]
MKSIIFAPIIVVAVVCCLVGCGAKERSSSSGVTIEYMYSGGTANVKTNNAIVEGFKKAHPEINVKLTYVPDWGAYMSKVLTATAGGVAPDVVVFTNPTVIEWSKRRVFFDLAPVVAKDSEFKKLARDIYPKYILEAGKFGKSLYGVPAWQNPEVVFYNEDLFDKAGIPYPERNWDLRKFREVAKALTKDTNGDGRADQFGVCLQLATHSYFWLNNVEMVNASGDKCLLDRPGAIEVVKWMKSLMDDGSTPGRIETTSMSPTDMFQTGRVAMFLGMHYNKSVFRNITGFSWDVAPMIKGNGTKSSNGIMFYCVLKSSKHPKAAWEFVKYMIGPEAQAEVCKYHNDMPILRSLQLSNLFLEPGAAPKHSKVFVDALDYCRPYPGNVTSRMWETAWNKIELSILPSPEISIDKACREATKAVDDLLKHDGKSKRQ